MAGEASGAASGDASGEAFGEALTVLVVADDLIWSTRLLSQAARAGAVGRAVREVAAVRAAITESSPDLVVVDLSGRSFDGVAVVEEAAATGLPVIAIAQHEAHELRKRALAAGARRVYANAKMHTDGIALLRRWLAKERSGSDARTGRSMTTATNLAERPHIAPERHAARLDALRERLRAAGADALLVGPGAELVYLAGYAAMPLERLTLLIVPTESEAVLVVPRLEREPAEGSAAARAGLADVRSWEETEDPYRIVAAALETAAPPGRRAGGPRRLFVGDRLWAAFVLRIRETFPRAELGLASDVLRALRMHKDADEVALLRAAAHAADRAVAGLAAGRLVGRSEQDVAREVRERLVAEGHDGADHAQIVGSGPNSASPHHGASERVIQPGEPVVLDIGGTLGSYTSDITRTIWLGGSERRAPDPEFARIYDAVREAHAAALAAVRPGVACEAIDAAARDVIRRAGYGPQFLHRTGHGIGLEVHEDPYIVAGNREPLAAGMAFSVEPGIYLSGRYGVRIEDIVICAGDGPDVLNGAPRDLLVVTG